MCVSQAEPSPEAFAELRRLRISNGWIPPNPSEEELRLIETVLVNVYNT